MYVIGAVLLLSYCSSILATRVPAKVERVSISPTTVRENETITVTCSMEGDPAPSYTIVNTYTNRTLASGVTSGTVTKTTVAGCLDSAVWACTATNDPTTRVKSTVTANATVYCAPRPRGENTYHVGAALGLDSLLTVNYIANPVPNITWEHNGETLPASYAPDTAPVGTTVLNVSRVEVGDFLHNYTLTMANDGGSYTAEYELLPHGAPQAPRYLEAHNVTNSSVTLMWTSGFDMGSRQIFILMVGAGGGYVQMSGNIVLPYTDRGINQTFTYTQRGLRSGTVFKMTVFAMNDDFMSAMSDPVEFATLADPTTPVMSPSTSGTTVTSASARSQVTPSSVLMPLFVTLLIRTLRYIG